MPEPTAVSAPESRVVYNITEIMKFLPHRYPFLLVDRIVEMDPPHRIVGLKNVTINEEFFQGHFPGAPVMPGVLILEAMAQVGGIMLYQELPEEERSKKLIYFTGIENAKFRRPVVPGDQLRIEIELVHRRSNFGKMSGRAMVEGKLAAEATELFAISRSPRSITPMNVHPTAIIHSSAQVAGSVTVGPYSLIGENVELDEGTEVMSHVVIDGRTRIGKNNRIFPFTTIGLAPQDLKYRGEPTRVEIGDGNTIRECVTIHRGTVDGEGVTRIGSHNLLMAYVHIAHDCKVGSHVIMANGASLAGHIEIQDHATVGPFCGIHQYSRIGAYSFLGAFSAVNLDILPYSKTTAPRPLGVYGANKLGLDRRGLSTDDIKELEAAFRLLTRSKLNTTQALEAIEAKGFQSPHVKALVEFIKSSERGVAK